VYHAPLNNGGMKQHPTYISEDIKVNFKQTKMV